MQPATDLADDAKYSQLAPLAVVAFVLGLASILALIGPLFFLVPVAAIGLALLALSKIRNSDGALSGARLAHLAIALATICFVTTLVRTEVRDRLLKQQARATAERWLGMMTEGRIAEARALLSNDAAVTLVPRPPQGAPAMPAEEFERIAHEQLELDPLVRDYVGGDAKITLESVTEPIFDATKAIVGVTFMVADAEGRHRHVRMQLTRSGYYEPSGEPWRIDPWDAGAVHGAH